MELINNNTLENIIKEIDSFEDDMVLYVEQKDDKWHLSSMAYIYSFGNEEEVPTEVKGVPYFLEISLINEVMEVWKSWTSNKKNANQEIVIAVIYYAEN